MTDARLTQDLLRAIIAADPDGRLTQEMLRVILDAGPDARLTQEMLRAILDTGPDARLTQEMERVVIDPGADARLTQMMLRVVWKVRTIPTPPTSDLSGSGYSAMLLVSDSVVTQALDPVIDGASDTVVANPHWT